MHCALCEESVTGSQDRAAACRLPFWQQWQFILIDPIPHKTIGRRTTRIPRRSRVCQMVLLHHHKKGLPKIYPVIFLSEATLAARCCSETDFMQHSFVSPRNVSICSVCVSTKVWMQPSAIRTYQVVCEFEIWLWNLRLTIFDLQ